MNHVIFILLLQYYIYRDNNFSTAHRVDILLSIWNKQFLNSKNYWVEYY